MHEDRLGSISVAEKEEGMIFERFVSRGLAHYSYLIGDRDRAVVIDPRRDCEVYVRAALAEDLPITHILETHRNEDYVVGSVELASRTGATILHSAHDDLSYGYGDPIRDGDSIHVGRLKLVAVHTPGHTPGHMSYLLYDASGAPWMVFTGDTLFAGEVGRTDFLGVENLGKMTGLLYDSLFTKILPLGDGVIVCPAHGAGSVCGSGIADRFWTTVGLERKLNPRLQHTDRDDFVRSVGRILPYAPYMETVERLNLQGSPILGALPVPRPLAAQDFAARAEQAWVVDTRDLLSFGAAHVPGAIALWEEELSSYAGWFLTYDRPILLVCEAERIEQVTRYLIRIGFDRLEGYLSGGMLAWHGAGLESARIDTLTVQDLCRQLDDENGPEPWVLDVRSEEEVEANPIPEAYNVPIKFIPQRMDELPVDRPIQLFCGSGVRSTIVASLLRRVGRYNAAVVLGGLAGWSSVSCPLPSD
jgi:hydroxyacylglutathione hydrolase